MDTYLLGGDILAERKLTDDELRAALSSLLSVSPDGIILFVDWEELPERPDPAKVYCRHWHLQAGEFHTVIDLQGSFLRALPRDSTASALARLLGCRVLVDDGSDSPISFLVFGGEGAAEPIGIDPEALDRDEVVLLRGQQ
jgi:hypothetical protein